MLETLRPDPTFHPSARLAMEAEAEHIAYTVLLSPDRSRPDALAVVDVDPKSKTYGSVLNRLDMPNRGDEFHHFGWNACSSALSPMSGHAFLQRRYLIIPGIRSSRIYVVDTQPDPHRAEDHQDDRTGRGLAQDRLLAPAHRALRARRHLHQHPGWRGSGRHAGPAGRVHHGLRDLRRAGTLGDRPRPAEAALRLLVEPAARLHGVERMGPAAAVRKRHRRGRPARQQVRPLGAFLGPARPQARAGHRSRRQPPDGARDPPGARPDARIRFSGRGGRYHQSGRLDLDLVPRKRRVQHQEDRHHPTRAGRRGATARAAEGLRCGAAADQRHRPLAR